ncbi:MAG: cbb3-type cytochrome c oxidase subunit 3 [Hyphomicrobiales bacterium]|nr:cbb3-type cytochrome c oxidase subunit 3 [Hyphomicrobiales bacterium]
MTLQELSEVARSWWVVWLMILFTGVLFWAFRPKNRKRFEEDAQIPFRDDQNGG